MNARQVHSRDVASDGEPAVDARSYASAILNILDDAAHEKSQLEATQKAIVNILEDTGTEKARLADTQRAILNILDDAGNEKTQLEATQNAILNVLEDAGEEKARLGDTQRAVLNILEDFDLEKKKVEQANVELHNEIEERARAEGALRHAKAAVEAASKELEAFSYSVAHDLRAPLRSIDGFSQALLEDYAERLDADGERYLNHVRDAAQQMGQLIDDLLNLSRVTRAELRREQVDLSELARTAMASIREAQPRHREVEFVVEDGLVAQADPRLLAVVFTNLLGNAWKFTAKRDSSRIEFGALSERPPVFFVRDNGAGFDQAYAGKLFGVFQRLHAGHEFEGTGIGLATVQRIVHRHGGRVWAEGAVDRGATFFFTLEETHT